MEILLTSTTNLKYSSSQEVYEEYSRDMQAKLIILNKFNNSLRNVHESCFVVLLTLVTNEKWLEIDCHEIFNINYFVCEHAFENFTKTDLNLGKYYCYKPYTLIEGRCWLITSNQLIRLNQRLNLSKLSAVLSAWSYGHSTRNRLSLFLDNTLSCYQTNGLSNHFFRSWTLNIPCDNNASLHTMSEGRMLTGHFKCDPDKHFRCASGTCILSTYVCDGVNDCADASDEVICADHQHRNCSDLYFHCLSDGCIPLAHRCDGWQHCLDSSDEVDCPSQNIHPCTDGLASHVLQVNTRTCINCYR